MVELVDKAQVGIAPAPLLGRIQGLKQAVNKVFKARQGGGFVAYESSEHFARRIDGFLTPDVDPRTQMGYATSAIQEGGFFGVGVGEGQVKWSLPDAHTDFIIAVAAEEYGLGLAPLSQGGLWLIASFFLLVSGATSVWSGFRG